MFKFLCVALILELVFAAAEINLQDYFDTSFSHYQKMTTSPMSSCDPKQLEGICFWKNMTYRVSEGRGGGRVGTIGPPHDPDICNIRNISYALLSGADFVKLYPPDGQSRFWTIGTEHHPKDPKLFANVNCSLLAFGNWAHFSKLMEINAETTVCHPLRPQDHSKTYTVYTSKIKKKDFFDNLLFLDWAPLGTNTYQPFIGEEQISQFLSPNCTYHADNRQGKNGTVIHCMLTATEPRVLEGDISFTLGLKNVNVDCAKHHNNTAFIHVTVKLGSKRIKRSNIFNNNSKIFRTAAPYARVTQPTKHIKNMVDYRCNVTNADRNPFAITNEGIVYVADTGALTAIPKSQEYLTLNVTWTKNNGTQHEEIRVRIVEEPNKTCAGLDTEDSWSICSTFKSSKACLRRDSCGLGTGGMTSVETRSGRHRCVWRGDKTPDNHETHLYSTCTYDPRYCPDGVCDSLERLAEDELCPQDCTKRIVFPTKLNEETNRGVDKCNGILVCDMGCSCLLKKPSNDTPGSNIEEGLVGPKIHGDGETLCGIECILLVAGGIGVALFAALFSVILWRVVRTRKLTKNKYMGNLPEAETPFSDYIERNANNEPLVLNFHMSTSLENTDSSTLKVEPQWKFPRQQIFIEQVLGEGEFGKVLKAKAFNIAGRPGYSLVAVKTLKDDARKQDYNDLFSEYQLLKEVNHPHVIQLLGVCSPEDGPLYVIIEYAMYGSLRSYLRRSRHILTTTDLGHIEAHKVTPRDILSFARQIASGMSYLSDIKLVHRDLAARNILLAENKVCKVSDFGLTRDIYEDNAYFKKSKGRVPVKWMAPESLADHVYTTKSDVWSFGILTWELITLGASPYPGIPVHNLYNLLKQGYRMERPPNCSAMLYSLMNRCWNILPEGRPSFLELYHCFDNLLTDNVNYLDLSDNAIINKSYFTNFSIEPDSGSSDVQSEKANLLKNNLYKDATNSNSKILNTVGEVKETCIGYETPVKTPRPVITPSNESPGEYTDMSAKNCN